jgi:hypothetical protein
LRQYLTVVQQSKYDVSTDMQKFIQVTFATPTLIQVFRQIVNLDLGFRLGKFRFSFWNKIAVFFSQNRNFFSPCLSAKIFFKSQLKTPENQFCFQNEIVRARRMRRENSLVSDELHTILVLSRFIVLSQGSRFCFVK